jgi:hypothetical protein
MDDSPWVIAEAKKVPSNPPQQLQKCRPIWIQRVEERRVVEHYGAPRSGTGIGKSVNQAEEQAPMHMKPKVSPPIQGR